MNLAKKFHELSEVTTEDNNQETTAQILIKILRTAEQKEKNKIFFELYEQKLEETAEKL